MTRRAAQGNTGSALLQVVKFVERQPEALEHQCTPKCKLPEAGHNLATGPGPHKLRCPALQSQRSNELSCRPAHHSRS